MSEKRINILSAICTIITVLILFFVIVNYTNSKNKYSKVDSDNKEVVTDIQLESVNMEKDTDSKDSVEYDNVSSDIDYEDSDSDSKLSSEIDSSDVESDTDIISEYVKKYVTTDITELRIRSGPGYDYSVVYDDGIPAGTCIEIQKEEYDEKSGETWGYVEYNGYEGWSTERYMSDSPTVKEPAEFGYVYKLTVTTDVTAVRMRSGPGYDYNVISDVPQKKTIKIYGEQYDSDSGETWAYVYYNDRWGWCTEKYLE